MYNAYKEKKLFGGLDGLRFFSISAVVWHHSVGALPFLPASGYGFLGVDLFFVISGFLIVTLLLREKDKNGKISLKAFYLRRSLRIFPLYYGFIFALTVLYLFVNKGSDFGTQFIGEIPIYVFYLANFIPVSLGIMWSLATEEQFYLLWPFLEKYFKKTIFAILAIFLIINQFVNFNHKLIADWLGIEDMHVFQSTFTPILLGVCLAHLLHRKSTFSSIHRLISPAYTAPILLLVLVAICSFLPGDISGLPRLLIQLTMVVFVGSVVINEKNMLMPILKFRPFARIGVISYGIYIFHIHGITIAEKVLHKLNIDNIGLTFLLGYTATIIIAELSFRLYEAPFLKLKAKFSSVHQAHT